MARYSDTIVDGSGYRRPVTSAQVYVLNKDGDLASLTGANPVITDAFGAFAFETADGVYEIDVRVAGVTYNKTTVTVGNPPEYVGPPGAADNTYTSLAAFKASDIARKTASLVGAGIPDGRFNWTEGNFTGQADDQNIIKANSTALSVGAWVRQLVTGVAYQAPATGAKTRPADRKLGENKSVQDFGASVGSANGSGAIDQPAFSSALAYAASTGRYAPVIDASYWAHPQDGTFIPPGVYSLTQFLTLTGNTQPFVSLNVWAVPGTAAILIPDGQYAITCSERINRISVRGLTFAGGKGAFQHTFTDVNVNGQMVFTDCIFDNYTECAIGNNATDAPYLEVRGCTFMAKSGSTAFGIAWGGYADGCVVENNKFLRNYAHIKWGPYQSGSSHFLNNDFIRWDTVTPFVAAIWFVPNSTDPNGVNSGNGHIVSGNKFGNENMGPNDARILVAREGTGATRQVRMLDPTWYPNGAYLTGLSIQDCRVAGSASVVSPFIRSYIGQLRNLSYSNMRHDGGSHSALVEFMGQRPNDYANMNWRVDLRASDGYPDGAPFSNGISNSQALLGVQIDPDGLFANQESVALLPAGGDDASFVGLASANTSPGFINAPNGTFAGAEALPTNDRNGQPRAVEVTVSGVGQGLYLPLSDQLAEGRQVQVSLMLAAGVTTSVGAIRVYLENQATGKITAIARRLVLTPGFMRVRLRCMVPGSPDPDAWQLKIASSDYAAGTATKFRVAEAYVYQARDAVPDGHLRTLGDGKWNGGHLVMGLTHIWEEGGKAYIKTGGAPTGPTDGVLIGAQT